MGQGRPEQASLTQFLSEFEVGSHFSYFKGGLGRTVKIGIYWDIPSEGLDLHSHVEELRLHLLRVGLLVINLVQRDDEWDFVLLEDLQDLMRLSKG